MKSPIAFETVKPVVVVSQCLGFAAVRYNGAILRDDFVRALTDHVRVVQVCPEVAIGLGVPRDPIRLVGNISSKRLVQPATGRDLTDSMRQYAEQFLANAGPVDGFILKSRSPSCGIKDVKVHAPAPAENVVGKSTGMFAETVLQRFPGPVEDEGRLTNAKLRHHFLVRLFASARLRAVADRRAMADLVRFHTAYKYQLMAYSQRGLVTLGRFVANAESAPVATVLSHYTENFWRITGEPPRSTGTRNALMHVFGYVSDRLTARERKHFLGLLEDYRAERATLAALIALLQSWVVRFEEPYLAGQIFFDPYPRALLTLGDTGR
jgi:uncharacterized protein YbgA (DUF1722 family)/uncharacterized protein YbbK (DUF523 family)